LIYGLHHAAKQGKVKGVDDLFSSGMMQCLGLIELTEIPGAGKARRRFESDPTATQGIHQHLNEVPKSKCKLFQAM
jgi:hypothetical protein